MVDSEPAGLPTHHARLMVLRQPLHGHAVVRYAPPVAPARHTVHRALRAMLYRADLAVRLVYPVLSDLSQLFPGPQLVTVTLA